MESVNLYAKEVRLVAPVMFTFNHLLEKFLKALFEKHNRLGKVDLEFILI